MGSTAHILHREPPVDPGQLAHYARFSQPLHLMLFAGGVLILLGWFGQFAFQNPTSGTVGVLAFLTVFLGVLFADLLHCVLEFSLFPLLIATAPYATPALVEATYRSTPLAIFQDVGRILLLVGVPLVAFSIARTRVIPAWSAAPFAIATLLMIAGYFPEPWAQVGSQSATVLYLSMTILGVVLFRSTYKKLLATSSQAWPSVEISYRRAKRPFGLWR